MTKDSVLNSFSVNLTAGTTAQTNPQSGQAPTPAAPDEPFCILVLGDFSGRSSQGFVEPDTLADRVVHTVDRDTFDDLFGKLKSKLNLKMGSGPDTLVTLSFGDLDDFHPDQLYESVDLFAELRTLRRRLQNPDTFAAAARQLRDVAQPEISEANTDTAGQQTALPDGGSLLDAALAATDATPQKPLIDQLIHEIVAPFVIPAPDPRLSDLLASVDAGIADLMRRLLHHPDFQALEANWRGLYSLVRNLETNRTLKIQLLDISLDELRADQNQHAGVDQSAFYQRVVKGIVQATDQQRPAIMLGCWQFGPSAGDLALLNQLTNVASIAEAPLLASVASTFVGCPSFDQFPDPDDWPSPPEEFLVAWNQLRSQPAARFLGLTTPNVLVRRPYSADIEAFRFVELTEDARHSDYLWGTAAVLCVRLIGEAFSADGWKLKFQSSWEVGSMPMHFAEIDGEATAISCAEGWLTARGAEVITQCGVISVLPVKGRDAVQMGEFRSIAATPLMGRWSSQAHG